MGEILLLRKTLKLHALPLPSIIYALLVKCHIQVAELACALLGVPFPQSPGYEAKSSSAV